MPRPTCPRKIAHLPPSCYFKPAGIPMTKLKEVELAADELESLRLADVEDLYRQDAARQMQVSRQTFDRILKRARQKVATALTQGCALKMTSPAPGRAPTGDAAD